MVLYKSLMFVEEDHGSIEDFCFQEEDYGSIYEYRVGRRRSWLCVISLFIEETHGSIENFYMWKKIMVLYNFFFLSHHFLLIKVIFREFKNLGEVNERCLNKD